MDKIKAIQFIQEVFTQPFDRERFHQFARELLNRFEPPNRPQMLVPDAFRDHVQSCQRLGTYESPSGELLDVMIVNVSEDYKIERTRTALRDFVAHKLKRGDNYKEAALVAFVPPSSQNWRFSYVRMEYETIRDPKTRRIKPEEKLTPARRYSYLVGESEKSHTAQKQLLPLLANDKQDPELSAIEQAFSVEKVTKEFFSEYARLFENTEAAMADLVRQDRVLRADFETKNVDTVAFTKKLLGQIVFLYFIQKKGWLGVSRNGKWGDGPRDFLRRLTIQAIEKKQCLFNDILEPLFYDTLATDRGHDAWCKTFQCRIPFLNGGLFEPLAGYDWENTEIKLPNSLFTNQERSSQGDSGTGILDVFDRYNFTVNEAEPLEKEVAIDPEMLGKVFENLIEENRRKGLGAFYTPREIVHYMCQESLINYLVTGLNGSPAENIRMPRKELEEWIHQSDQFAHYAAAIAAGTKGAHYHKPPESIRQYAREIDDLLRDITVCDPAIGSGAFPVGMMTEVVRARTALTPYFNDVAERTVYHFKRHAIQNSLYGVDIDVGAVEIAKLRLWLSLVVDEEDVQQIKPLPNLDYKIVTGNSLLGVEKDLFNQEQFKQLEELKPKFFNETDRKKKSQIKKKIEDLIHELTNGREVFDFEIYFSEVFHAKGGFDVVIANPPWGAQLSKTEKAFLKTRFQDIDSSTPNSFAYFIGLAFKISSANLAYVLPDSILIKDFAKTRKLLTPYLRELHWYQNMAVPTSKRPFLDVEHDVCIIIGSQECSDELLCSTTFYRSNIRELERQRWMAKKNKIIFEEFNHAFNLMLRHEDLNIMQKIRKFPRIDEFMQCHEGIHTGNARDLLFKREKENKRCRPLFYGGGAGDTISNYASRRNGWFVDYRKELIDKSRGLYASLRDERIFQEPKIYITRTGNPFKAFLDEDSYASNNFFSLQFKDYSKNDLESLKVILPFILAPITQYFIRTFAAPRLGNTFVETKIIHLLKFCIPILDNSTKDKIRSKVNQILAAKQGGADANVNKLERELDHLVYELYGLTKEEIEIVEGTSS